MDLQGTDDLSSITQEARNETKTVKRQIEIINAKITSAKVKKTAAGCVTLRNYSKKPRKKGIALSTNQNGIEQLKIVEIVSPWAFNYAKRLTERLTEETLMRGQKCRHKK